MNVTVILTAILHTGNGNHNGIRQGIIRDGKNCMDPMEKEAMHSDTTLNPKP